MFANNSHETRHAPRRNYPEGASMKETLSHSIVIIGGGDGGIPVASRLRRACEKDVTITEPSGTHTHQLLWPPSGAARHR